MSSLVMIAGRLHGDVVTKPTRNGGQVTFFKLKVVNGSSLEWWGVAAFSETAREELDGLGEGDAVSAVGLLRVETFEHNGETRIALKLTADRVLALKPKPKEAKQPKADKPRAAPETGAGAAIPLREALDDDIPF
jgi:single-stranded DNA-binding protein